MIIVKSKTIFYDFFHDESFSFAVCNYLWSCDLRSKQSCFFPVCSTNKSLRLSIKGTSVCTRMVNNYIKSYKIKEIFGEVSRRTRVKGKLVVSRLNGGLTAIFLLIYWSLPIKGFFNTQALSVTSWSNNFWCFRIDFCLAIKCSVRSIIRRNSNTRILLRFSKKWQGK